MKHTMKKLLCMALAIMLLVSAVPVFAAAEESSVSVPVDVFINGSMVSTKSLQVGVSGRTLDGATAMGLLENTEYRTYDHWASSSTGSLPDGATIANDAWLAGEMNKVGGYRLSVYFNENRPSTTSKTVDVHVYYADGQKKGSTSFTIDAGGIQLSKEFGQSLAGGAVEKWAYNSTTVTDTYYTVDTCPDTLYLYLTASSSSNTPSSTGTITAKFSVDGANEVTMKFSADAKTVSELISLGGYSAYEFSKAGLGGSGASRGLTDTINAGETVYIKMKTPTTPTNPSNPNTPSTANYINFAVKVDSSSNVVYEGGKVPANGSSATINNLLKNLYSPDWASNYTFDYAWSTKNQAKITNVDDSVYVGDSVTVMLKSKNGGGNTVTTGILNLIVNVNDSLYKSYAIADFTQDTINNLLKAKLGATWSDTYIYNNTKVGTITYGSADVVVKAGQTATVSLSRKYSKDNSNKVYLHVYLNGDASTIAMTKDITGTYLMDDWKTDTNEILNYLKNNYYTAKDSSNAITIDGLYVSTDIVGAFPANYYADNKVASKDRINDLLETGYVHISVMLKNAKAKTSATADTSNPKTGDTIFVPVMVMGLTASALAAAYVIGKKRFAR